MCLLSVLGLRRAEEETEAGKDFEVLNRTVATPRNARIDVKEKVDSVCCVTCRTVYLPLFAPWLPY